MPWICPCGASNPDSNRTCGQCGKQIAQVPAPAPAVPLTRRGRFLFGLLGAFACLWILIRGFSGPHASNNEQQTKSPSAGDTASSEQIHAHPAGSETPLDPEKRKLMILGVLESNTTETPLDPEKRKLILERTDEQRLLKLYERMLAAPSFSARVDLFCEDAADAYMMNGHRGFDLSPQPEGEVALTLRRQEIIENQFRWEYMHPIRNRLADQGLVLTVDDLKAIYTQLMGQEPSTREAEISREQKLHAIREELAEYNKEFTDCRTVVVYGEPPRVGIPAIPPMPLPTDDEMRKQSAQARERMAQIEHELASGAVSPKANSNGTIVGAIEPKAAEAVSQSPAVVLNNRGIARLAKGDLDGAIQDFTEAIGLPIGLKHDYAESFNGRGVARQDKGDLGGAIQDYSEAIRLKPDYAIAFDNRGVARHARGDLDGAIQDHSEAIRLSPEYARASHNRGTARHDKGDLGGAIQDFTEAIRLQPDYAESFNGRGTARHDKGDLGGAIQDFTEAIRLQPDYAIAFDNRGEARLGKGDLDGAIHDFSEAIRLKPDYARALHNRGAARGRKGDAVGAQQDNNRAIQLGWH